VKEDLAVVVACDPCGGAYSITYAAADAWLRGRGASTNHYQQTGVQHMLTRGWLMVVFVLVLRVDAAVAEVRLVLTTTDHGSMAKERRNITQLGV
jgi:hypothetical protein